MSTLMNNQQPTIVGHSAEKYDQFFTDPDVAAHFVRVTEDVVGPLRCFERIIEPSAGGGSFFYLLPENSRVGIDIDAAPDSCFIKRDFLSISTAASESLVAENGLPVRDWGLMPTPSVMVIGNPPFGKNAAMAIEFVNHAFLFADTVCFIVPRTFNKASVQERLVNRAFHLVYCENVQKNAFSFNGKPYDVPCSFHIWKKMEDVPPRPEYRALSTHPDFQFVSKPGEGVFAIQRVGTNAGRIKTGHAATNASAQSHYYIKPVHKDVLDRMTLLHLELSPFKFQTAGCPSISKDELIRLYSSDRDRSVSSRSNCLCVSCTC